MHAVGENFRENKGETFRKPVPGLYLRSFSILKISEKSNNFASKLIPNVWWYQFWIFFSVGINTTRFKNLLKN